MRWKSSRPKKEKTPKTKIDRDVNRQLLLGRIIHMMRMRQKGMAPFPFQPRGFYRLVWGEDRVAAMGVLPIEMFRVGESFTVHSRDHEDVLHRPYCAVRIGLGSLALPVMQSGTLYDDRLPPGDLATLNEWAILRLRMMREADGVIEAVRGILNTAVTYGQLRSFWPTLEQFMSSEVREMMRKHRHSRASDAMIEAWRKHLPQHGPYKVDVMLGEAVMFDTAELDDPVQHIYS